MNPDDLSDSLALRYETPPEVARQGAAIHRPWVTFGILGVLLAMFVLEEWLDFGGDGPSHALHVRTLELLGGLDRTLILGSHQWYRLFMAPLLHADLVHILLNGLALLLAGYLVERLLGRAWTLALFFIGALCGSLASMITSSDDVVSVGASGAIMALFAAAMVATLHLRSGSKPRRRIQAESAQILFPSLLPVASGASSLHVDYGAHFGGAIAGAGAAWLLLQIWPVEQRLPRLRGLAWGIAAIGSVLMAVSVCIVALNVAHAQLAGG